jgi:hypothetical protein
MTNYNNIQTPCFGTLAEIHAALVKDLNWLNEQVTINGWGYTVKAVGFASNNNSCICRTPEEWAVMHPGVAILTGMYPDDKMELYEVITLEKIPHISKRCPLCGDQLDQDGMRHGTCSSCYAEECGH